MIKKLDYYLDRAYREDFIEIADRAIRGNIYLWNTYWLLSGEYEGNIFFHKFSGSDKKTKEEYLLSLDFCTYILKAYKVTGDSEYQKVFNLYFEQFLEYVREKLLFSGLPAFFELPIYAHTLLIAKAQDVIGDVKDSEIIEKLLIKYATYLTDKGNQILDNNHGVFEVLALLHLGKLLGEEKWEKEAISQLDMLFANAYYDDYTNNENSLLYFNYNNNLYNSVIDFCKHYEIELGKEKENVVRNAKTAFETFVHKDGSVPIIGDGEKLSFPQHNEKSAVFPEFGIAVIKQKKQYLSFKTKTKSQPHAHLDVLSLTVNYDGLDIVADPGQYNYDRYTPINRFLRSSAGHSAVFPVFMDGVFLKEFCDKVKMTGFLAYEENGSNYLLKGGYEYQGIKVERTIDVYEGKILVTDRWNCDRPNVIRQRFIISPKIAENGRFIASEKVFKSQVDGKMITYRISEQENEGHMFIGFSPVSYEYDKYDMGLMIDFVSEVGLFGKVTMEITIKEDY